MSTPTSSYKIVLSKYCKKCASVKKMDPETYIDNCSRYLSPEPGDLRTIDKHGELLTDVQLFRADDSWIIIHPVNTDVHGYQKLELTTEQSNGLPLTRTVYVDDTSVLPGINFIELQKAGDSPYRDCVANKLLHPHRLSAKFEEASQCGSTEAYIGTVMFDEKTRTYKHFRQNRLPEEIYAKINQSKQQAQQQDRDKQRRKKLLGSIDQQLNNASLKKIEQIAQILGIDINIGEVDIPDR